MNKYIHELKIGNIKVDNNVFLAPMAGVTDKAFREIVRDFKPGLTFTEMASSKALEFDDKKTNKLLSILPDERPSIIQIFGNNKETVCQAIEKLNNVENIDIIDINTGCPAPKLVKNGCGAGMLLDLKNLEEVLIEAVKVSKKPITLKTRKGFNNDVITAIEVAKLAEKCGICMITVHGRTREEYYSGVCDFDIIKAVKENVSIPVIGNGDIVDVESARYMFEYTGCDGIMVARGAMGKPWIFQDILENKNLVRSNKEKIDIIFKHIDLAVKYDTEKLAKLKLRKHISWYLKGIKDGTKFRDRINKSESTLEIKEIVKEALK